MKYISFKQKGEVSLFVVIFATLLLTIVTVSFVRIMLHNQQQASTIDLSQSAFDSAQAGVEDAKRAILHYQTVCGDPSKANECNTARNQINSLKCNDFTSPGGLNDLTNASATGKEVVVQNNSTVNSLDQAYTCTTIIMNTPDYIGTLDKDGSELIPLLGTDGTFKSIQINWFTKANYPTGNPILRNTGSVPLLSSWSQNMPPVLRAQLIQFGGNGFKLSDFDGNGSGQSDINTVFLYPSQVGINQYDFSANDTRRSVNPAPVGSPWPVKCQSNFTSNIYACTVNLTLPDPIGAGERTAFLRLSAAYNSATYQVLLKSPTGAVNFNGVQPIIDSTGRASNMFRRVQSRVKLNSNFPYPNAEIFTSGNLCKNFLVTDNATDFPTNNIGNTCTP